jgi:hypothetical protein
MFHTYKIDPASVPNAATGMLRWFIDESTNMLSFVDENGDIKTAGNTIASIAKTQASGNVDTYTITYVDGGTTTFTVTNGNGLPSDVLPSIINPDDASSIGTQSSKYALSDHTHGVDTDIASALGNTALEGTASSLSRSDHVHPFPTAEQVGATTKQYVDTTVSTIPKRLLNSFTVDFPNTSDIFYTDVVDSDVSVSKPPHGFTVKPSELEWDISYKIVLLSVQDGSFNVSVVPEDISGDTLIGLPLPAITVYYLKEVNHA